jgi:hypothetical protein
VEVNRPSDVDLLRDLDGIVHFDAEVANDALDLGVTEQKLTPAAPSVLRRLLSITASGTKRRRKLVWLAFFPAAYRLLGTLAVAAFNTVSATTSAMVVDVVESLSNSFLNNGTVEHSISPNSCEETWIALAD